MRRTLPRLAVLSSLLLAGAFAASTATVLAAPPRPEAYTPPNPLIPAAAFLPPSAEVRAGDAGMVEVRLQLKQAVNRPITARWGLSNGRGTYAGPFFDQKVELIKFRPGEDEKIVQVRVKQGLRVGNTIQVWINGELNQPGLATVTGSIVSVPQPTPPPPPRPQPTIRPVDPQAGLKLAWRTTFKEPIKPVERLKPREEAWASSLAWSRIWNNGRDLKEIGVYADPAVHGAAVAPHIRGVPGVNLRLRAAVQPVVEKDLITRQPKTWPAMAPMLSSFGYKTFTYGLIKLRARVPRCDGFVPAFWLEPIRGGQFPETDIFESGMGKKEIISFTQHLAKGVDGTSQPYADDDKFHDWSFRRTRTEEITYLDGAEISRRPNQVSQPQFIILSTGVGMGGVNPSLTPGTSCDFDLDSLEIWE